MTEKRKVYANQDFRISVSSEDCSFLDMLDRYLCFPSKCCLRAQSKNSVFAVSLVVSLSRDNAIIPDNTGVRFDDAYVDVRHKKIYMWLKKRASDVDYSYDNRFFLRALSSLMNYYRYYHVHASLVRRGNESVIFLGKSCSGKSTLAALLATQNYDVCCDDWFFVKKLGAGFVVKPLPTKVNVRNHINKRHVIPTVPALAIRSKLVLGNEISVILPSYSEAKVASLIPVSKKEGMDALLSETIFLQRGLPRANVYLNGYLDTLFSLGRAAQFYCLQYNDQNLFDVPGLIAKRQGA